MIYLTGDTHGEFRRFSNKRMHLKGLDLTEKDYIIICGDMGLCWAKDKTFAYYCENLSCKPYTILWVQGNHENYDMLEEFPLEEWHGGKVRHIVRDKIILLERGQIFELEGKRFFTFGGASSHDIQGGVLERKDINFDYKRKRASKLGLPYRILGESWWPQELPSKEEMLEGLQNLEKVDFQVDYVITHCCSTGMQMLLGSRHEADVITEYFEELEKKLRYQCWYFGHYHMTHRIDEKHMVLYEDIVALEKRD